MYMLNLKLSPKDYKWAIEVAGEPPADRLTVESDETVDDGDLRVSEDGGDTWKDIPQGFAVAAISAFIDVFGPDDEA